MSLAEIVQCCPWRLDAPRPLTPFEWTVVEQTIFEAISSKAFTPTARVQAVALTQAIRNQNACPAWKTSQFGPDPAVALYAYGCLGSWWGALDPVSQGRALADIGSGLLCSSNPPWSNCPLSVIDPNWRPESQNEYSVQKGVLSPGVIPSGCSLSRQRTAYFATTGQGIVDLVNAVGGGLSPQIVQMVNQGGSFFAGRSFIVGLQFKNQIDWTKMPVSMASMSDLLTIANAMLEDVALIWAPGQGTSIRSAIITGQMDPAALLSLMQALAPGAATEILANLPALLPGLIPPPETLGPLIGMVFGTVPGANTAQFAESPGMKTTGLPVVDEPAQSQDPRPPTANEPLATTGGPDAGTWLAIAGVALGSFLFLSNRKKKG